MHRECRLAVQQAAKGVGICAKFDTGDVAQTGNLAVRTSLYDDLAELLLTRKPPKRVDGDLKGSRGFRLLTDRAGCYLHVLFLNRRDDVAGSQPPRGHLGRVEPDPH